MKTVDSFWLTFNKYSKKLSGTPAKTDLDLISTGYYTVFKIRVYATDSPYGASVYTEFKLTVSNNYP